MDILSYLQWHWLSRRHIVDYLKNDQITVNNDLISDKRHELDHNDMVAIKRVWESPLVFIVEITKKKKKHGFILVNKPKGYVVSKQDPVHKTIYELLPPEYIDSWYYIWRLDRNSHGLVVKINTSETVHEFEHPSKNIKKEYTVIIDKVFDNSHYDLAYTGIFVDDFGKRIYSKKKWVDLLRLSQIKYFSKRGKHTLLITLTEWKKRHIRRFLRALGYKVKDLMRTSIDTFSLADIKKWNWKKIMSD